MPTILVTAKLDAVSGLAEDAVQNSWVLSHAADSPSPGDTLDWVGPIDDFYGDISYYLSDRITRAAAGIKFNLYNITTHLAGGDHGSPIATDTGTVNGAAGSAVELPSEVAHVLTLRGSGWQGEPVEAVDGADADAAPDRPRSRRTGRLYLGPLNIAAMSDGRPIGSFLTAVENAYVAAVAQWAAVGITPRVWSRKASATYAITHIQQDNAFDTQRRRGVAATSRTTVAL